MNAQTRGYELPSWVDFESLAIARKGIESSWETRANAVSVGPVEVDVIAASPKPTYCKAACEGRQYQVITCADCKTSVHAEGSRQTLCKPCGKKRKLVYQAKWKAKLSPEKRDAARGRRKRTVTSFGGAESASASNGSSGVGSAAARTPKEGEYGKQN